MNAPSAGELRGRLAVVTGSARGIGRAIALELARAGAAVVVHGRSDLAAVEAVCAEIGACGGQATAELADLAEPHAQDAFFAAIRARSRQPDIWVNNAGADILTGPLARLTFEEKLAVLWRLDVLATMRLSRLAGVGMQQLGGGAIVNVGWDGVEYGMAGDSAQLFAAAKGAVAAFSRSLAQSLAPAVRVNCVAPGWIRTAWGAQAADAWQRRAAAESLQARWGLPDDVAAVVRFLVSPAAAFVNAQIIQVNGGRVSGWHTSAP